MKPAAKFNRPQLVGLAGITALVGMVVLYASLAAGTPVAFEAEDGVKTGAAGSVALTGASGGSAVKFGSATPSPTPAAFVHPGIILTKADLDATKAKMYNSGGAVTAPWSVDWSRIPTKAGDSGRVVGAYPYTPVPHAALDCTAVPAACVDLRDDAVAAYTMALQYSYSKAADRAKYADNAIDILNAYSATVRSYANNQSRLETGWAAGNFAAAAEIVRYTYTPAAGQSTLDVAALNALFTNVFIPNIIAGDAYSNGNWELAMAKSLIDMGVFMDDHTTFDRGVAMWRARVPAYIYLASDGPQPQPVPGGKYDTKAKLDCFWAGAGTVTTSCTLPAGFNYQSGMNQETCRDMSHVSLGMNELAQGAETAYIQGVDLYGEQQARIIAGYEFAAKYNQQAINTMNAGGTAGIVDASICGGTLQSGGVGWKLGWEMGYHHYVDVKGLSMPLTKQYLIDNIRTSSYRFGGPTAWQTLTHAAGMLP